MTQMNISEEIKKVEEEIESRRKEPLGTALIEILKQVSHKNKEEGNSINSAVDWNTYNFVLKAKLQTLQECKKILDERNKEEIEFLDKFVKTNFESLFQINDMLLERLKKLRGGR